MSELNNAGSRVDVCDAGVNLEKHWAARAPLEAGLLGEPLYGMLAQVGLPQGFTSEHQHA